MTMTMLMALDPMALVRSLPGNAAQGLIWGIMALGLVPGQPLVPGHGVGGHGAVGVADVQLVRGIVDGGGDIKALVLHWDDLL